jgi:crotonobetaine/carnitine-CoA ligase
MTDALVVGEVLRHQAQARPDALFLWCGDDRMTFAEADARADSVAAGLAGVGVAAGDRVAFVSSNRPEMLEMLFGCARLGAIQVPLNAFLKGEFLRYQLADSGASTLVVDDAGYRAARDLLELLPDLRRIVVFDPADDTGTGGVPVLPYEEVRSGAGAVTAADLTPSSLISIVYTSGTTGLPKGCMLTHGYYLNVGKAVRHSVTMTPEDVYLTALPLFHGAARMMVVMAALGGGSTAVIEREFRASTFMERAIETGATLAGGVGAMAMALLAQPTSDLDRTHGLRWATWVPLGVQQQQLFEARFGVPTSAELYGQTECVPVTYSHISGPRNRASAGLPVSYLEVRLHDDDDREVGVGEVGEICVRPREPLVMFEGYWRKPEETLKAFRNLWYHTGDYGRRDDEGFITFVDRKKDALRRRGENVSSMELEMAIAGHPHIAEAAVVAVPSEVTEDDIKALVVVVPGETLEPEELFTFFKERLPYFAIPRYVELVPELPKNAMARVMKHLLRDRGVTAETWDFEALGFAVGRAERR